MKILIIGPSWVGDMVMSQSLYITLKKQHPNAIIDVMAPAWCKPILERMPEVNQAIEMPFTHGQFSLWQRIKLGSSLKASHYQHAYILPNSAKSAIVPFFAKIPHRTGWKGEMRYGLLNDIRANKKSFKYMVERYVALAFPKQTMQNSKSLGGLSKQPKPALSVDKQIQDLTRKKYELTDTRKVIGLCPGAEFGPAKRWPEEHYAIVAEEMVKQGYQVWIFGSAKDQITTDKIHHQLSEGAQQHTHKLSGKTSLIEAVDLLASCESVVSNDSGLMHIAAAVNCNVIALYGSTSPEYTPPLTHKVHILQTDIECRPCFKKQCQYGHLKCLTELSVQQVLAALNPE
jgi:heptosyltransferase-2